MKPQTIAAITILVALAIATNYAMLPLYNIKLMDIIVFIGGFVFGPFAGASVGIFSWIVYGTLNPMGFSLNIWLATMFSEAIFGIAGGLVGRNSFGIREKLPQLCLSFAAVGALLTLAYDTVTNVVWGYTVGPNVISAVIIGFVPFGLIHVISNFLFFGFGCVPAISAVSNVIGVNKHWDS
jgi:hypothetical protein